MKERLTSHLGSHRGKQPGGAGMLLALREATR